MATKRQPQPEPHEYDDRDSIDEIDEAWIEKLRRDPRVVYHERDPSKPLEPFVPILEVTEPIDVLVLLGRRDDDDEE
jgi:hypothetical protein